LRIPEWAKTYDNIMIEIQQQLIEPSIYDSSFGRINPQDYTLVPESILNDMF